MMCPLLVIQTPLDDERRIARVKPGGFELLRKRGKAAVKVPPRPGVIAKKSIRRKPDGFFLSLASSQLLGESGQPAACENPL